MESLGQRIFRLRKARGYSQQRLADLVGVTQGTISQWEDGRVNIPSSQIPALASSLQVAESELFSETVAEVQQSDEARRLLGITAILRANPKELGMILTSISASYPHLLKLTVDKAEHGAS